MAYTFDLDAVSFALGDVLAGSFTGTVEDDDGVVDLSGADVAGTLSTPDDVSHPLAGAASADTVTLTTEQPIPLARAGLGSVIVIVTTGQVVRLAAPARFVVDRADGWATLGDARHDWRDAAGIDDVTLYRLLDSSIERVTAYARKLGAGVPIPSNYVAAQLMMARDTWTASKQDPGSGQLGGPDSDFAFAAPSLSLAAQRILRPRQALAQPW